MITNISYGTNDLLMVVGDFNLPDIDWLRNGDDCNYIATEVHGQSANLLVDNMARINMCQMNNLANIYGNVLDLFYCSDIDCVLLTEADIPISIIDNAHRPFIVSIELIECVPTTTSDGEHLFNYQRANFDSMNESFNKIDLSELSSLNTNNATELLYSHISSSFHRFIPKSIHRSNNSPPWFTKDLINLKNRKNKAYKRFKSTGCRVEYEYTRAEFDALNRLRYECYIDEIQAGFVSEPKKFWEYVNYKKKTNGFPSKMSYQSHTATSEQATTELFAKFFGDNFTIPTDMSSIDVTLARASTNTLEISLSLDEVMAGLLNIDTRKGRGPDDMHPIILKNCAHTLAAPLHILFNKSLAEGIFPDRWKSSYIQPIFKSGKRACIENYRGIAILPTLGKFFESLVHPHLYNLLSPTITPAQHGFISKRSCVTNLTQFVNITTKEIASGGQMDVLFTDFRKAFDRVDQTILIDKIVILGVCQPLAKWLWSYLHNRKMYVKIGSSSSSSFYTKSGVPQGSHLGPLLFLIFINDLATVIRIAYILLYADDAKLLMPIRQLSSATAFQRDITAVADWCTRNNLPLNTQKCKVMSFTRKKLPIVAYYHIDGD